MRESIGIEAIILLGRGGGRGFLRSGAGFICIRKGVGVLLYGICTLG